MKRLLSAVVVASVCCACTRVECAVPAAHVDAGAAATAPALARVDDARHACMAIDRAFDEPQLTVSVEGRSYGACCEECRERLKAEPALRRAVDPVSKRSIDKASAVLARDAQGGLHYFESAQTLAAYRQR